MEDLTITYALMTRCTNKYLLGSPKANRLVVSDVPHASSVFKTAAEMVEYRELLVAHYAELVEQVTKLIGANPYTKTADTMLALGVTYEQNMNILRDALIVQITTETKVIEVAVI